jgi:hypothetical protein
MIINMPMLLYHVTPKDRVAKIRSQGLKPHVPGKVWGLCDPAATRGKPIVCLRLIRTHFGTPNTPIRRCAIQKPCCSRS